MRVPGGLGTLLPACLEAPVQLPWLWVWLGCLAVALGGRSGSPWAAGRACCSHIPQDQNKLLLVRPWGRGRLCGLTLQQRLRPELLEGFAGHEASRAPRMVDIPAVSG